MPPSTRVKPCLEPGHQPTVTPDLPPVLPVHRQPAAPTNPPSADQQPDTPVDSPLSSIGRLTEHDRPGSYTRDEAPQEYFPNGVALGAGPPRQSIGHRMLS